MNKNYSSEGIILWRRNFGEADRIVSVYTRNHGRMQLLAKGIRKPKSKKRGHLEVFSHINFSATRTDGIGIMTETETVDGYGQIRDNLPRVSLAYYFMEVISSVTHGQEKNEELFDLLVNFLTRLKTEKNLKIMRNEFCTQTLIVMGFWPRGKKLESPDDLLEEIVERKVSSVRVGKRLLL